MAGRTIRRRGDQASRVEPVDRPIGSGGELRRDFGDAAALVASAVEIDVARLAAAVAIGDRAGAIRRIAMDFLDAHLPGVPIVEPDDRQPEMQQVGYDREQRDFLATMLARWSRNMPRPATSWPHLGPYLDRMRARPGFREVYAREGLTEWMS